MTEQHPSLSDVLKVPGQWLTKILGISTITGMVLIVSLVGLGGYGARQVITELHAIRRGQDAIIANMRVLNGQAGIREIIEAKLPKLSPDQQSRIALEIYEGCRRHQNYPAYIVLGIIEKESTWNINASNADAVGLMQVRPSSAMQHVRALGVAFTPEALQDPVMNVVVGLRILFDCQDAAVLMGRSPRDQYVRGLFDYNGGGEPYARLVLTCAAPYQKKLDACLQAKLPTPAPEPVL